MITRKVRVRTPAAATGQQRNAIQVVNQMGDEGRITFREIATLMAGILNVLDIGHLSEPLWEFDAVDDPDVGDCTVQPGRAALSFAARRSA